MRAKGGGAAACPGRRRGRSRLAAAVPSHGRRRLDLVLQLTQSTARLGGALIKRLLSSHAAQAQSSLCTGHRMADHVAVSLRLAASAGMLDSVLVYLAAGADDSAPSAEGTATLHASGGT